MDKLQLIKDNWKNGHMNTSDGDWLIEEIERLRAIEQAYQATMKAYRG